MVLLSTYLLWEYYADPLSCPDTVSSDIQPLKKCRPGWVRLYAAGKAAYQVAAPEMYSRSFEDLFIFFKSNLTSKQ